MEHHHHNHNIDHVTLTRAFVAGIVLNVLYVLVEFGFGCYTRSMGLMSDAGHNLTDVLSLLLALVAMRMMKTGSSKKYTYGLKKSTVLASLLNAVLLLVAVGLILAESVRKLITPVAVEGTMIAWIAAVGVLVNAITAWLFVKDKDKDLNIKGAYMHMAADALVSVGVVVSGVVIYYTHWYIIDPIIGIAVAVVIIMSTWKLMRDSVRLSLDGVPEQVDYEAIDRAIRHHDKVVSYHHMHVWALSTTHTALTVHVVVAGIQDMPGVKADIKQQLSLIGISHVTLEMETAEENCTARECE